MRDPEGEVAFRGSEVVRTLRTPISAGHFLRSKLAAKLVAGSKLLPFEVRDAKTVVSPRLPFVTQPTEWCDTQLFDAASLTLELAEDALQHDFELKDASAWNVLFEGTTPVFCDHLSFDLLFGRPWWAGGQFSRHFLTPLLLSRRRGLHGYQTFLCWRDGVPSAAARQLLGRSRFMTRYWPLTAEGPSRKDATSSDSVDTDQAVVRKFRERLHTSLQWMLSGVAPADRQQAKVNWATYVEHRPQYPDGSIALKRAQVDEWIRRISPIWVVDLGCNTGEFTELAMAIGAMVVAIDADHASVDKLYRSHRGNRRLHPLVATIDDLPAGRGWAGCEYPGLDARARGFFDLAMMLAVVHHLAIGASIPLERVAELTSAWTRRWLIVEWIHPEDPQLQLLCRQRRRNPADFAVARQIQAFANAGFAVEAQQSLGSAARTLALLSKAP